MKSGHTKPHQAPGQGAQATEGGARDPTPLEGEGERGGTGAADAEKGAWRAHGARRAPEAAGRGTPLPADAARGGAPARGEGDATRSTN